MSVRVCVCVSRGHCSTLLVAVAHAKSPFAFDFTPRGSGGSPPPPPAAHAASLAPRALHRAMRHAPRGLSASQGRTGLAGFQAGEGKEGKTTQEEWGTGFSTAPLPSTRCLHLSPPTARRWLGLAGLPPRRRTEAPGRGGTANPRHCSLCRSGPSPHWSPRILPILGSRTRTHWAITTGGDTLQKTDRNLKKKLNLV